MDLIASWGIYAKIANILFETEIFGKINPVMPEAAATQLTDIYVHVLTLNNTSQNLKI